ncbi:DNA replication/repair protein RecF [Thermosyntropha sp.]|uniref:DNA replication/repair protein RecF n=1 Tax=Thermosyntropha sp. TaxID=2740820 RepID=UPI0025D3A874|nr:DNA replication/repair protein RecF [Thermosyntropha sp.]MBO8159698.1 DNA replication/repair protein RecF [Thermosyntropha sp.]
MKIETFKINDFRNIKEIYLPKGEISNFNIFIGNNGQGKTNILEALYILSMQNSFRTSNYNHLINYDREGFRIRAEYNIDYREFEIELKYQKNKKKEVYINRKKASKKHPYCPKVVLFTPDDLYLIKGSPVKRRNFIDSILKQLSNEYAYFIEEYGKIIKKRNFLLKKGQSESKAFSILNQILVENGTQIILHRINFINILEKTAAEIFQEINQDESKIKIKYALSFPIENDKINTAVLKEKFDIELKKIKEKEIIRKTTLIGPHLDDINFYYDNKLARSFASQGQQRNMVIALKLAEIHAFYKVKGFFPVFLLDEVLSELDQERKILLLRYLEKSDFQTFLTSVKAEENIFEKANLFYIENGSITRKGQS